MMRILAASDIHGNRRFYRGLPDTAQRLGAEAIVLAGDLLGYPDGFHGVEEAQRADAKAILGLLESLPLPVFYIMGNDDFVELGAAGGAVRSLHGRRVEWGTYNLVGYQYSLPFMGGIFEKTEEAMAEDLLELARLVDDHTVLVTHSPAKGFLDTTILGIPAGSVSILELVNRQAIRAHIHGHVHSCFGRDGCHFNVASDRSTRAMLIDVKHMTHQLVNVAPETSPGSALDP